MHPGEFGTFAVQIAKTMGLHVTAVCSAPNAELAHSLAGRGIDYNLKDFVTHLERYDMVLDLVGNRSLRALRNLVHPSGTLACPGGVSGRGRLVGPLLLVRAELIDACPGRGSSSPRPSQPRKLLEGPATLVDSGAVRPVIDKTFTFEDGAEAIRYLETDHARAKVIVTIPPTDEQR